MCFHQPYASEKEDVGPPTPGKCLRYCEMLGGNGGPQDTQSLFPHRVAEQAEGGGKPCSLLVAREAWFVEPHHQNLAPLPGEYPAKGAQSLSRTYF